MIKHDQKDKDMSSMLNWYKKMLNGTIDYTVGRLLATIFHKALKPEIPSEDMRFVEQLRSTVQQLPPFDKTNFSDANANWLKHINRLVELLLTRDPMYFLRWEVIRSTMFVGKSRYANTELKFLKHLPDWQRWKKAIEESTVGHPSAYLLWPRSSSTLIHHAYHLAQFEDKTGMPINTLNFVFEFGGGYGSMARLFYNQGFKGKYLIFDLPPFSALQQFFLKSLGLEVCLPESFNSATKGALCISDFKELKSILLNQKEKKESLFISNWAISESPINLRDSLSPFLVDFGNYILTYQYRFAGVDNIEWFAKWKDTINNMEWHNWEIKHIPGSYYLLGKKKRDGGVPGSDRSEWSIKPGE